GQGGLGIVMKESTTLVSLIIMILLTFACSVGPEETKVPVKEKSLIPEKHHMEYGINCDTLHVIKDVVQPNQNLSNILLQFDVPYSVINAVALVSENVFDVRKIKSGNPFCIISTTDSTKKVRYFVYELNPVDYVVFELDYPVAVYIGKKEVQTRTKTVTGFIESSLWQTLTEQQLDPELAIKLSEIYAWDIDFHHLRKGDGFRVIFEERFVEGILVGLGRVKAAVFKHKDKNLYAFYFRQDDSGNYYDQNANSMQKAFLKSPIKFARITSGYSKHRFHPVLKKHKAHFGIDYAAKTGTPIMSTGDGVILKAGYDKNNGKYVKIKHNGIYTTQYLHMSKIAHGIKQGVKVKQGDVIGYVGSTGLATGPHLCYRFWKNGKQVDPFKEDIPSVEPVQKEYISYFNQQMTKLKQQLEIL
ncbi:MAG: peptidoglycan DD-metalloendopeptidase family protein, partial [Desulfobulbaceae bacterium]|nr:peptidoglycan DD-metalloendopeptidase family protein [Desulfobulbaceae bacterium]